MKVARNKYTFLANCGIINLYIDVKEVDILTTSIYGVSNYYNSISSLYKNYPLNTINNLSSTNSTNKLSTQSLSKNLYSSTSSYLTSLQSNMSNLTSASKPLLNSNASFSKKTVTSSDSTSVSGTATSTSTLGANTINITQLATEQNNIGNKLNSTEKSSNQGLNTFSLKVGDSAAKSISYTVSGTDTNKSALEKMASSINSSKSGVTANVVSDSKSGTSYINLLSDKTGTNSSFSLEDISGSAVATSGTNLTKTESKNAEYTLDGKQATSQSNTIAIDNNKTKITLTKASGKDVTLTTSADTSSIKDDIKNLLANYNKVINFAETNVSSFSGAQTIEKDISSIMTSRRSSLASMGITINNDKTVSIDDKKLDKSLKENLTRVKDVFSGNYGVAQNLNNKASTIAASPLKYTKPTDFTSVFSNFYNYLTPSNSLVSGQNMYTGTLLDSLV